ncbi:MAG: FAD-dependent thymidylate synthase [Candidatus Brocadiae bacterium]|nr:FAD-dependent thymidylate synthase [Candidatus Brocadiia bacterium]
MTPFLSGPPSVRLVNAFHRPFENAVATARTCYSAKGIITPEEVGGDREKSEEKRAEKAGRRDSLARSIYEAGHHTTLQHAHFQFALDRVSRHCIWAFLHSHPFYNSEQVSQRYVEVKEGYYAVPPLTGEALRLYTDTCDAQVRCYQKLIGVLTPMVGEEYYRRFAGRRTNPKYDREVKKKAQETARYVLPVSIFAYMYHTVSGLTLLRYWRMCEQPDAPAETRALVGLMVEELLRADPLFKVILEEPVPEAELPETAIQQRWRSSAKEFCGEFDAKLGGRTSALTGWKTDNERGLADAVREVFGLPEGRMTDDDAIAAALDPRSNRWFGESMNVTTLSHLSRTLHHPSFTFRKKLSHTADSQDQRHRMTPASRPVLLAHLHDEPDYVAPEILRLSPDGDRLFREAMDRGWDAFARLKAMGVPGEFAQYVLPNAVSVRFSESSDLLNLHHKLKARLCYNAQEEIWRASKDEAEQIREVNPRIGRYLQPPCGLRWMAGIKPSCPEGDRYCGIPVWKIEMKDYVRTI